MLIKIVICIFKSHQGGRKLQRNKTFGYLLAFFLGVLGIHAIYYKKYLRGVIYATISLAITPIAPLVMIMGWIDMFFIKKWHEELETSEKQTDSKQSQPTKKAKEKIKQPKIEKATKDSFFYTEEEHILNKYAHLSTPKYISEGVDSSLSSEYGISVSITTNDTRFIKDSYNYRRKYRNKATREIPLQVYWTTFDSLNERQFNWYLYWRTQALNKNYIDVDLSYIILFVYELMNYSFNSNAAFNVSMMETLYEEYHEREPKLNNYLPQWIADMLYELNEVELAEKWAPPSIEEIPKLYTILKEEYPLEEVSMNTWNTYIKYGRKSAFFEENRARVYNVFKKNMGFLEKYYEMKNESLIDHWFEVKEDRRVHYLFRSAVIGREVDAIHVPIINIHATDILIEEVTALMKYSENVTREMNGISSRIKVNEEVLPESLKKTIKGNYLTERKTEKSKHDKTPDNEGRFKVVKYHSNTGTEKEGQIPKPSLEVKDKETPDLNNFFDSSRIEDLRTQTDDLVDIFSSEEGVKEVLGDNFTKTFTEPTTDIHALFSADDIEDNDYMDFISALNEQEENFIKLFSDSDDLKISNFEATKFIQQYNSMLGVFLSELNNKANECLGDVIIDTTDEEIVFNEEFVTVIKMLEEGVVNEN